MFRFICKTLLHPRNGYTFTPHNPNPSMAASFSLIKCFPSDSVDNPHSFTVSYLINSCGLSYKSALKASKSVQLNNPEKPDLILSIFEKLGFSKPQISEIIRKSPEMLHCKPDKTIFPKVEFFRSKGASTPDIVRIFTAYPPIFHTSLENQLVPSFNFLTDFFESEYKAIESIKRCPLVLIYNLEAALIPNINNLRKNGVPASNVPLLFSHTWRFAVNPVKFGETVEEVKEMGFNPLKQQFVKAIIVLSSLTKTQRDQKVEAYKRWGWSDEDIINAFKKFPQCIAISKDNIMAKMDFYVNKLGLEYSVVLNCPLLLGFSLEKRLIPRGAVIQYLSSKGLIELDSSINNMFKCSEMCFLEKYVKCHEEAPHLIELYNQKLNLSDTTKSGKDEE